MDNYQSFLQLLQLSSPSLPLGAYSYSEGLEYLVIKNIQNQEQLLEWLTQELLYGAIRVEGAIMLRSLANFPDLAKLNYWNNWLIANRETSELRQQSVQMGKSLSKLLNSLTNNNIFQQITTNFSHPCNYALAFGMAVSYWKIDREMALLAFLQTWVNNLISAGIKLIPLGQTTGQKLLTRINSVIINNYKSILTLPDEELYCCSLGLGLASMNHEQQYTRLFRS